MTQTRYAALLAFTIIMIETGLTQSAVPPIERTIPHPDGPPNPPMKCTIQIVAGGTAASAADLANVSKKLQDALDQSEDMQKKVDDACRAWSMTNGFMIRVFRGSMTIPGALARNGGPYIDLDLTDLEQMNGFMKGDPGVTGTFGANFLTATLAHEIDHMRDGPKREGLTHQDPDRNCADATRGPAVDDENKVMADMHFPIARLSYGGLTGLSVYRSKDDEKSPFAVFFYQDWLNHIAKLPPSTSTQTPAAGPAGPAGPPAAGPPGPAGPPAPPGPRAGPRPRRLFGFDDVPERACGPGASTGCFPPASTNDRDLDGTADSIDNCPALPNRQGDQNADGIGDACDRTFPRCGTSLFTRPLTYVAAGGALAGLSLLGGDDNPVPVVSAQPVTAPAVVATPPQPQPTPTPPPPQPLNVIIRFIGAVGNHPPNSNTSLFCAIVTTEPPQPGASVVVAFSGPAVLPPPSITVVLNAQGQAAIRGNIGNVGTYTFTATMTVNGQQFTGTGTVSVTGASSPCPTAAS